MTFPNSETVLLISPPDFLFKGKEQGQEKEGGRETVSRIRVM